MKCTTLDYGRFVIDGYTNIMDIRIVMEGGETPQDFVKKAIMFANEHRCTICRRVEYTNEEGVTFKVKCNSKTSRWVYDYGTLSIGHAKATANDIKAYMTKFGTDRCIHRGFKKKYWYTEGFHGETYSFDSLDEALKSAKKEHGGSVTIWTNVEMHSCPIRECEADASGIYLP